MVQVLPVVPTFGSKLAEALGEATGNVVKGYQTRQQKRKDQSIFDQLQNPELTPMQRLGLLGQLSPDTMKSFSHVLPAIEKSQGMFQAQNLENEQLRGLGILPPNQQQNGSPLQNALNQNGQQPQFNPQNLTDDQLKGMLLIPRHKAFAQNEINNRRQERERADKNLFDQLSSGAFGKGYQAILDGDDEAFNRVIADPDTTYAVKKNLTDIRNQVQTRLSVKSGEQRRNRTEVLGAYKQAINTQQSLLKEALSKDERLEIKNRIKELEDLRKKDLQKLAKNPDAYNELAIWGSDAGGFLPTEEEEQSAAPAPQSMAPAPKAKPDKIKFDKSNPEHVARAKQALQEAKGDKAQANQILSQEFSL